MWLLKLHNKNKMFIPAISKRPVFPLNRATMFYNLLRNTGISYNCVKDDFFQQNLRHIGKKKDYGQAATSSAQESHVHLLLLQALSRSIPR